MRFLRRLRGRHDHPDLACQEVVEIVTFYLEGAVSDADRQRLERHLSACDGCDAYMDQMRRTISATGQLSADQLPPPVLAALQDAFNAFGHA